MRAAKFFHKKRIFYALLFMFILFSPLFSYFTFVSMGYTSNKTSSFFPLENAYNPSSSSNNLETSSMQTDFAKGYNFSNSASYKIEVNFKVWSREPSVSEGNLFLWQGILNSQGTSQFPGTPYNQIVNLAGRQSTRENIAQIYNENDNYGNNYDFYNLTFVPNYQNSFSFDYVYDITLRETNWTINPASIGLYNKSEPLYINNTGAEPFLQVNDPLLENLSYQICNASGVNNIVDKAYAIYNWLVENMTYQVQTANNYADKGALQAYKDRNADCSEFSDLMVTLLRIQGIPARKVVGFVLAIQEFNETTQRNEWKIDFNHKSGDNWVYDYYTLPGHAWMQYYVPNYGWISCDPTWGNHGYYYFNRIDNLHFLSSIGETYGGGITPSLDTVVNEFPPLAPYQRNINSALLFTTSQLNVKITELHPPNDYIWTYVVGIIVILISVFALVMYFVSYRIKARKEKI